MNNQKGSVLAATLTFILVFSMLGISTLYLGGIHNTFAQKEIFSEQALWLADGGIERAKLASYPFTLASTAFGNGTYNFSTVACTLDSRWPACNCSGLACVHRWRADSTGIVNNQGSVSDQVRNVQAVISQFSVNNAITADGTINADCSPDGSAEIKGTCEQNVKDLTLQNIFGLTYTNDRNGNITITHNGNPITIDHKYTDSSYKQNSADYSGLTVITSNNTQSIFANQINTNNLNDATHPGFLIIDCSQADPCFKSTGTVTFFGIIWVIGNANMTGTPNINGSLFVQNGNLDGNVSGSNTIKYDEGIINDVLDDIGGGSLKIPTIVSWKEI